uniref:Uncharacterized protein LOC114338564 n=1 Tax=Diabrotica virgifera virgifera TaxID=50390 RepID=A0A6P7G7D5_DIAVI
MDDLNIELIKKALTKYIGEHRMIANIEVQKYSGPVGNYLCDKFKMEVKVKNKEFKQDLDLVAKCSIHDKGPEFARQTALLIKNEILCYETIIPCLREFRVKYKFPDFECFPDYIASHCNVTEQNPTGTEAVLILENLCPKGYTHQDSSAGYNLKQSTTIIEELASLHATWLALKYRDPELFIISVIETILPRRHPPGGTGDPSAQLALLRQLVQPYEEFRDLSNFDKFAEKMKQKFLAGDLYNPKIVDPFALFIHSDICCSNIMQILDDDENIVKLKILDYQLATVGSPVRDLLYFIVSSVRLEDLTTKHFYNLIKHYHATLKSTIQEFGVYTDLKYSYELFCEELKAHAHEIILQLMYMLIHVNFRSQGEIFDPTRADLLQVEDVPPMAKQRICFLMREAAKKDWLEI